jgi:hypothetical protein
MGAAGACTRSSMIGGHHAAEQSSARLTDAYSGMTFLRIVIPL